MRFLLSNYVIVLGWVLSLVVIMSGGLAIMAWLLNVFTAEINVWKEIKRKNLAMGILLAAVILGIAIIVSKLS
ncbi:MAG: DUF350 domain-containing protein [Candidatus Parcubacteria bacterium]|nr:DUF350 domain-containing protein [Candidatus Parcubacteria bacterium]